MRRDAPDRLSIVVRRLDGVLGIAVVVALLWPDGSDTPARLPEGGPGASPATSAPSPTTPGSRATPAPAASGVEAALANLRAVITAARQQGTADQEAEDLLGQAGDLAKAPQENPKDKDKSKDEGKGKRAGQGEVAAKKVAELERKVDELISQGKIRPPATTQIQQAVAQLAQAVQQAGSGTDASSPPGATKPGKSNGERARGQLAQVDHHRSPRPTG
jgi:hypothetical protein